MLSPTERRYIWEIVSTYEREFQSGDGPDWTPEDVIIGIEIGAELDSEVRLAHFAAYLRAVTREELLALYLGN